jgi:hypothetical protein
MPQDYTTTRQSHNGTYHITLAEITSIDGNDILSQAVHHHTLDSDHPSLWDMSVSLITWPQQVKPTRKYWKTWKTLILSLTTPGTMQLKTPLGQWQENWHTQRRWQFHINDTKDIIVQRDANNNITHFIRRRRTVNPLQKYHRHHSHIDPTQVWTPITPTRINPTTITVKDCHLPHILLNLKPTHPTIHGSIDGNNSTRAPQLLPDTIYIATHTIHSYERQIFTWVSLDSTSTLVKNSAVQSLHSIHCASVRGGLISLTTALEHIILTSLKHINNTPTPKEIKLVICSSDAKLIILNSGRRSATTPKNMMTEEQGLYQELTKLLQQFNHHRLHHSYRHDEASSDEKRVSQACRQNISTATNLIPTKYQPNGAATIWHLNTEISSHIESTLHHAAATQDL